MVANKIVICISVLISTSCAQMNVDDKLEETQVTMKRLDVDRNTIPLCLLSWNFFLVFDFDVKCLVNVATVEFS